MLVKLISSQHWEPLTKSSTKSRLLLIGKHLFFDREDMSIKIQVQQEFTESIKRPLPKLPVKFK